MAIYLPFLVLLFSFLFWISKRIRKGESAAPILARGSLPIIGHLHLLGGPEPLHYVFGKMAELYGPIFTVKMGLRRALVVSDWEIAKECLTTHDKVFANRPNVLAMELLGYERTMFGLSPYGDYWRQIRKFATFELLSTQRLETFRHVRESEVRTGLNELHKMSKENKLVEMKSWFGDVTLNVLSRMIVGKWVGYGHEGDEGEWKEALRVFFELAGRFVVADGLPFLRWFDIGGHEKRMKDTAKRLESVMKEWLKEHKEKRATGGHKEAEDFMDLMLDLLDETGIKDVIGRDSDTINKATCLALVLAGSDSTSVTLTWALSLLVNHPDVLKRIQDELDIHVGRERHVLESDMSDLVYLQAVAKETMRLYPPGPLAVPHESMEDCTVANYHVPKGTMLFVNIWKIHLDPRVYSDPHRFYPERFLSTHKDFDVRGQSFKYIPFSNGRRMCAGVSFAMQLFPLTLASVLHSFDFSTPTSEPVDMTESIGLTNLRATPLNLVVKPRLQSHLYS